MGLSKQRMLKDCTRVVPCNRGGGATRVIWDADKSLKGGGLHEQLMGHNKSPSSISEGMHPLMVGHNEVGSLSLDANLGLLTRRHGRHHVMHLTHPLHAKHYNPSMHEGGVITRMLTVEHYRA